MPKLLKNIFLFKDSKMSNLILNVSCCLNIQFFLELALLGYQIPFPVQNLQLETS